MMKQTLPIDSLYVITDCIGTTTCWTPTDFFYLRKEEAEADAAEMQKHSHRPHKVISMTELVAGYNSFILQNLDKSEDIESLGEDGECWTYKINI
jgi:hypothetical protein